MTDPNQTIKEQVRDRYGRLAEQVRLADTSQPVALQDNWSQIVSCCAPPAEQSGSNVTLFEVGDGVSCCQPADASAATLAQALYGDSALDGLPGSVTDISLGCGNPTAIANLQPGETVLDLGSGGGIDCFLAAKQVGPAGHVIGVDMTDSMLALANRNKTELGVSNVEFRKGEIENLPVDSDSVDVIISNCVINLSPDKDAVFAEAFRVLKAGGRFTVSDMVTEGQFPEQLRHNVAAWAGCITGALDQADYLAKLRRAGFKQVEVESRVSYGLEAIETLPEADRQAVSRDLDWATVPDDVRLYSARIVAYKP